ncbi:MAG: hypothetical protein WC593_15005 [Methanoregula sp.]
MRALLGSIRRYVDTNLLNKITAANDFFVGSGIGSVVKKTLAETKVILGLDDSSIDPGHKHSKVWASDGSPEAVTVDAAGQVGIGATPGSKLYVQGTGAAIQVKDPGASNTAGFGVDATGGNFGVGIWHGATQQATFYNRGLILGSYVAAGNDPPADGAIISGAVGIGTAAPNGAALLNLSSTTKGFLPPVMTTAQKNAVATPPAGLMIFDSNLAKLCVYTGAAWETIVSS